MFLATDSLEKKKVKIGKNVGWSTVKKLGEMGQNAWQVWDWKES